MPERERESKSGTVAVVIAQMVQVYEFHDGEDGKTYRWNATEGRRLAEARNAEVVTVGLREAGLTRSTIRRLAPEMDVAKALSLPVEALLMPLLFVPHNGKHVCIDGWHRIFRALHLGINDLPTLLLTEAEERAIRLGGD